MAFSCKHRGFCPSCGARRIAESGAHLVIEVLPFAPMRQWVLSVPFPLRFLFASRPPITGQVLGIVYRVTATYLTKKASLYPAHGKNRSRHFYPAIRISTQSEHSLPHAVSGWCLYRWHPRIGAAFSLGQSVRFAKLWTSSPRSPLLWCTAVDSQKMASIFPIWWSFPSSTIRNPGRERNV